jgi:membrane-associated phospholipid phosphatase
MKNHKFFQKYSFFFWQPQKDLFKKICQLKYGKQFLLIINYIIWIFLFFVSYLLIKQDKNIFWQLLLATTVSELIEKILKSKLLWKRPLHLNNNILPNGILKSWYQKGSFPSGHAIKAAFFFILLLHSGILISPLCFLFIISPLILVRIILGLHYPIDILGGIIIGLLIGFLVEQLHFPLFMINSFTPIFNFVFLIK